MKPSSGLVLVAALLVLSLGLMALMKWMELRTQAAGAVGDTALLAEAQRMLGPKLTQLDTLADLNADGSRERIGRLTDATGRTTALIVVSIVRKKVRTLVAVSAAGIVGGDGKALVSASAAPGYAAAVVRCPDGLSVLELQQLGADGKATADPLYLRWDAAQKGLRPADGC